MKIFFCLFFLVSSAALAQEKEAAGCKLQIEQSWVSVSASSLSECFRITAAAASPGVRQIASYGSRWIAYLDGNYTESKDNGQSWRSIRLASAGRSFSSLNVLNDKSSVDSTSAGKDQLGKPVAAQKSEASPNISQESSIAVANENKPADVKLDTEPTQEETAKAIPAEAPAAGSAGTALNVDKPAAELTQPVTNAVAGGQGYSICSTNVLGVWSRFPVQSIQSCGNRLVAAVQSSGVKRGSAYWAGTYLAFESGQLYQSSDGEQWTLLK